jgi:hypothetical protein
MDPQEIRLVTQIVDPGQNGVGDLSGDALRLVRLIEELEPPGNAHLAFQGRAADESGRAVVLLL